MLPPAWASSTATRTAVMLPPAFFNTDACIGDVTASVGFFNSESQIIMSQTPQNPSSALQPHANVRRDPPLPEGKPSTARLMKPHMNADVAVEQQKFRMFKHAITKRTSLSEKADDEVKGEKQSILKNALRSCRSTRDVISRLHHANASLQAEQPLYIRLKEYQRATEVLENKEDKFFANPANAKRADQTIRNLADQIIRDCVLHIDEPGACGESPVHLAFLLGMSDLGNECV